MVTSQKPFGPELTGDLLGQLEMLQHLEVLHSAIAQRTLKFAQSVLIIYSAVTEEF